MGRDNPATSNIKSPEKSVNGVLLVQFGQSPFILPSETWVFNKFVPCHAFAGSGLTVQMHSHVYHPNLTISAVSTECTDAFTNTSLSRRLESNKKAVTDVNETQRGCWQTHSVTAGHARVSKSKANVQQTPMKEATVLLLSGSWAGRVLGLSGLCQTPRHQSGLSIFPATSSILTACPLLVSWPLVAFAWIGAAAGPSLTASRLSSARYRNRKSSWDFHIPGLLM